MGGEGNHGGQTRGKEGQGKADLRVAWPPVDILRSQAGVKPPARMAAYGKRCMSMERTGRRVWIGVTTICMGHEVADEMQRFGAAVRTLSW